MSLPWILTEYILESNDTEIIQYMFYPFEMYNDSASRALNHLKSKFMYDELAAEVRKTGMELTRTVSCLTVSAFPRVLGQPVL